MDVKTIVGSGAVVARGEHPGTYNVRVWVRSSDSPDSHKTDYSGLSWTEAVDVMLAELDAARPGFQVIDGEPGYQPPLWDC